MEADEYKAHVELMLNVLPFIGRYPCFALKGGTAINFFLRDMPRYSIDIDLTYLSSNDRSAALSEIGRTLKQIAAAVKEHIPGVNVIASGDAGGKLPSKLRIDRGIARVKIEPNLTLRGTVYDCEISNLCEKAQAQFLQRLSVLTLSLADLYGGKLCAALDRQHPRDLFDVKLLFKNEGLTDEVRMAFVVYLASSDRPMRELLQPSRLDIRQIYETDFRGMTTEEVGYDELINVRETLIAEINRTLTSGERNFLLSLKEGKPSWDLFDLPHIKDLPAIRWKLLNIQKMEAQKRAEAVKQLERVLYPSQAV